MLLPPLCCNNNCTIIFYAIVLGCVLSSLSSSLSGKVLLGVAATAINTPVDAATADDVDAATVETTERLWTSKADYTSGTDSATTGRGAGMDVECAMRVVAYEMAMKVCPPARKHSATILQSLNVSLLSCPDWNIRSSSSSINSRNDKTTATTLVHDETIKATSCGCRCRDNISVIYVDCENGNDDYEDVDDESDTHTDDEGGFCCSHYDYHGHCIHRPLKSLHRAQEVILLERRRLRRQRGHGIQTATATKNATTTSTSQQQQQTEQHVTIYIRGGNHASSICYLNRTLHWTASNVSWKAFPNEQEQPILSGGAILSNLIWMSLSSLSSSRNHKNGSNNKNSTDRILVATLPDHINVSAMDGLFTFQSCQQQQQDGYNTYKTNNDHNDDSSNDNNTSSIISNQIRLVRARYPNGNSELDRMPTNYDKLGGAVSSVDAWKIGGMNVSVRFPGIIKPNSSFYPYFGHSKDIRWVQDFHYETNASSSYYSNNGQQFWHPHIATAARYQYNNDNNNENNNNSKPPSVSSWGRGDAILHAIHYNWWGNWQFPVREVVTSTKTTTATTANHDDDINPANSDDGTTDAILKFGKGGWQDAHGGAVSHNYFFIENVLQELDTPGEWYVDIEERKLYYWPLPEQEDNMDEWEFVATQIPVIVHIQGDGGGGDGERDEMRDEKVLPRNARRRHHPSTPVRNIQIDGITFAHSTTSFLTEPYTVPSAGDWSVLPKGAVTIQRAVNVSLNKCTWQQVNGNGVALYGMVHDTTISNGDFLKIGDSGIVSVGRLPKLRPYSGYRVKSVPTNITISKCHFGQTGVYGKQTSALFVALSKRISFVDNVLYDGPRAGININDGFGGGHLLARNVIFNQLLESGDHGPINTWSRSAYVQEGADGLPTVTPEWNHIDQNFVMVGPKFGALYGPGQGPCSNGDPEFYCPKKGGSMFTCLDHDDGSEFYLDTRNVCAFAGMKNYIGQDKIWDSNLLVFPEGAASQNRSSMSCIWTSMDMSGDKEKLPCSAKPCRTREVFTNNTCMTYRQSPLEYDMFNETDLAIAGSRNTTIPYTARNHYYLTTPYRFQGKWNLSEAKKKGVDMGSNESDLETLSITELSRLARTMLGLDDDEEIMSVLSTGNGLELSL